MPMNPKRALYQTGKIPINDPDNSVLKNRVKFCVGDMFWGLENQKLTSVRSFPTREINILQCNGTSSIFREIIDFSRTYRRW